MTAYTAIKLSPAMVDALKGARVFPDGRPFLMEDVKQQTLKGLSSRGLTHKDDLRFLTTEGVEAARQLGNDTTTYNDPAPVQDEPLSEWEIDALNGSDTAAPAPDSALREITPEMVTQAAENLLKTPDQLAALDSLLDHVDKPVVVPNREDKRKARGIRAALSRLGERRRARKVAKYGQTNYKGEALSV